MDESSKLLLTVAIPTVTVLVGILVNNRQLDQLSRHVEIQMASLRNETIARIEALDTRISSVRSEIKSLRDEMIARLERVEGVLDARLKLVEDHLKIR
jgi:outer membrane murein-binding lipoprotein Lpp